MHICNYCGRVLKHDYEKCPGCGSSSFKNKAYLGETIIKNPPKDGYKVNTSNYEKFLRNYKLITLFGIFIILSQLGDIILAIFFPELFIFFMFPFLIGLIIVIFAFKKKKSIKKEIARIKILSKSGILVKAMPYELVNTGVMVMGKYYKCIKVNYKNSAGVEIPLYSETKYNADIISKTDDSVDLLIDPDDYSNYFIDFEIY